MNRDSIFRLIEAERDRQDQLHPNRFLINAPSILGEEVGEVHKAVLEGNDLDLKTELIQVAAVCVRWLENL